MVSLARRWTLLAALPLIAIFAACDRHPHDPGDHAIPVAAELVDRATGTRLAWTHGTGAQIHWDGAVPHLHEGDEVAINVRFLRANGTEIPLTGEYTVRARLAEQQRDGRVGNPGIVRLDNHGDHVDITGLAEGETYIVFDLWHGSHADWSTPPIEIEVEDH